MIHITNQEQITNIILLLCRYAEMVEVGDSVLVENMNEMVPAKVEHISLQMEKG